MKPKITKALPTSARALGSGTNGGPEGPQLGVPMTQGVPGWVNSFSDVPKLKVTELIVVFGVIAESAMTNVPAWLI
jgi:hypothetical protein